MKSLMRKSLVIGVLAAGFVGMTAAGAQASDAPRYGVGHDGISIVDCDFVSVEDIHIGGCDWLHVEP